MCSEVAPLSAAASPCPSNSAPALEFGRAAAIATELGVLGARPSCTCFYEERTMAA